MPSFNRDPKDQALIPARLTKWIAAAILLLYLIQVAGRIYTRVPWCDEGFFGDPAATLLHHHYLGSQASDPNHIWLTGDDYQQVDRFFYYLPPLYPLALAGWWAAVGYGLQSMRWMSVLFGLLLLGSTYSLARSLTGSSTIGLLSSALLSIDYHFVMAAADGRMDCMDTALGFAGLAVFLYLHERNQTNWGVLGGHTLTGLGTLAHPNAVFYIPLLLILMATRRVLTWRTVLLGLLPYCLEFGAWGVYISENPVAFAAQFKTNLAQRLAGYREPFEAIAQELTRYYISFAAIPLSDRLKVFTTLPLLASAFVLCLHSQWRKRYRDLLLMLAVLGLLMTFFMGRKWSGYLIDILPLYVVALAVCLTWLRPRYAAVLGAVYCVFCGLFTVHAIYLDRYHKEFVPVSAYLQSHTTPQTAITGAAYLGFATGFERLEDDFTFGLRRRAMPDILVYDEWYDSLAQSERLTNPPLYEHIQATLKAARPLFEAGQYHVYACADACKGVISAFQQSFRKTAKAVP